MIEKVNPHLKKVARRVSYTWPGVVTAEELEQDTWLYILENENLRKYLTEAESPRTIQKALERKCHNLAAKARMDYDKFRGAWFYNVAEAKIIVKQLILQNEVGFDHKVDFETAFKQLSEKEQNLIRYWGWGKHDTSPNGRKATSRAFGKLVTRMNTARNTRVSERTEGLGTNPLKGNRNDR